ncbi:MAG: DNA polymerase III subunit alpha [Succinatimonas hippei]|nr:DNA polymerase III subunit alpha [Succinatimonas hippei]
MTEEQELDLDYIPLHVHSCYSINDGLENVGPIVKRASKMHFPAIAVTDWCNMAGFVRFYNACKSAGIKPIMGADLKVREKSVPGEAEKTFWVTLLAMNRTGKQNLYDILSRAWLDTGSPDIAQVAATVDDLAEYSEGIILLDGFRGDIALMNTANEKQEIEKRMAFYMKYYPDRFCFEITRTGRRGESEFESVALDLCLKYGIPPVATNDTRFLLGPDDVPSDGIPDFRVHQIRVCIQKGVQAGDLSVEREYSDQQYLRSAAQMRELFSDLPEALANTRAIAARCNTDIELDVPRLPHFDTGKLSAADYLRKAAHDGLDKRLEFLYPDPAEREKQRPRYEERLKTELNVIIKMDFPGYFLIVMEFIQWSKDHGVPVGPGRGSGGGSLVAYALRITDFDPLRFDLLFERFLNPERVSMPDFDVDFCQKKRAMTLRHVVDHYGRESVSQIAAFGTLAPKAAIQGAGRALGTPLGAVRRITAMIPEKPGVTFNDALGIDKKGNPCTPLSPDFLNFYNNAKASDDKETIELIDMSRRLEGVIRSIGKHAAGVVISPTRIAEFAPEMLDSDGNPITQYDKKDVEHAGLVKFDFLGLTTLTIIDEAKAMIDERRKREGKEPLNIAAIPYDDEASYKMLQQCETTAVFQLESTGMRQLIGKMQPDRIDDLVALVALYRPGPLQSGMVDHFVERKHGREKVCYPQPDFQDLDLKPILDSTYGVIVYQEQVMQIAQVLAGYSLGGADILRRAMGKKIKAEMDAQKDVFRRGAAKKGKDVGIAMKIFEQVQQFAEYGFNKSHSAAYALVAWWTLWLKVHYPAEFLASMMTSDCLKTEKLISYISEANRLGVKVNPPDVNIGRFSFGVDLKGNIVYGFSAIKGIGERLVDRIQKEREQNGPYSSLFDLVARVGSDFLSKGMLEALIKAGALDCFGQDRASMMASIPTALRYASQKQENNETGQMDLFSSVSAMVTPSYVKVRPWSEKIRLAHEKKILGLYLSGHPIDAYKTEIAHYTRGLTIANMQPGTVQKPRPVRIAGVVVSSNMRMSKKNDGSRFYIVTLDDSTGTFEVAFFGAKSVMYQSILDEREKSSNRKHGRGIRQNEEEQPSPLILIVDGMLYTDDDGMTKLRVQGINSLEQLREREARVIKISIDEDELKNCGSEIAGLLEASRVNADELRKRAARADDPSLEPRGCTLDLMIGNTRADMRISRYLFIPSDRLIDGLRDIAGSKSVRVIY